MDVDQAISGFAKLLKPAGTLVANSSQHRSQTVFNQIMSKAWDLVRPVKGTGFEPAKTMLCALLDDVAFPEKDWKQPMMFLNDDGVDFESKWDFKVRDGESEEIIIDRDFWAIDAEMDWMRAFVDQALPWANKDEEKAEFDELFKELENSMGGTGKRQQIAWPVALPVALLLATKM
ncbi:MAG: hypothetical protein Q9179_000236 [Wetmoreana sp. 5 TL-2023]